MASIKGAFVELVLRAKNLLSSPTEDAADSMDTLAAQAQRLKEQLTELDDQRRLVAEFGKQQKAVESAAKAYDRAQQRLDKLGDKLEESENVTRRQVQEFYNLQESTQQLAKRLDSAQRELGELGDEAQKAGIDTENLSKENRRLARESGDVRSAVRQVNTALNDSGESHRQAAKGAQEFQQSTAGSEGVLRRLGTSLSETTGRLIKWGAAAAAAVAALSAVTISRFTAAQAELARQTLAQADAFGVSAEELQKFQFAAESVGVQSDKAADILKDVAEKIGDAFLNGAGEAREVIQGLGLDLEELVSLRPDEQIRRIGASLSGLPRAGQVQILEALASDASLLLPLLENSNAELNRLSQIAAERGAIFTADELQILADVDESFDTLGATIDGFRNRLLISLAPAFERLAEAADTALRDQPELFDAIAQKIGAVIENTERWITSLKSSDVTDAIDRISRSLKLAANSVSLVSNAFVAVVSTIGEFGSRGVLALAKMELAARRLGNRIGAVSDEDLAKAEVAVGGLSAVVDAFDQSADSAADGFVSSAKKIATGADEAGEAAAKAADETARLAQAAGKAGPEIGDAASGLTQFGNGLKSLSDLSPEVRAQILALEQTVVDARAAWQDTGSAEAATALNAARVAYQEAAIAAGITSDAVESSANTFESTAAAIDTGTDAYKRNREAAENAASANEQAGRKAKDAGKAVESAASSVDDAGGAAEGAAGQAGAAVFNIFNGWAQRLNALSQAAAAAFTGFSVDPLVAGLNNANAALEYTRDLVRRTGIGSVLRDWSERALSIEAAYYSQAIAVRNLQQAIEDGDRSAIRWAQSVDDVSRNFQFLDRQQLAGLQSAVDSVKRQVDGLNSSLLDTISNAEIELAGLRGETERVQDLRAQQQIEELEARLAEAEALGDRDAISNAKEALRLQREIADERKRQLAQAKAEEKARQAERAAEEARRDNFDERQERQDTQRTERRTTEQTRTSAQSIRTIRLEFSAPGGARIGAVNALDDGAVEQIIQALQRAGLVGG